MRKSLWSPDEDEKLRRYVATHGCGNWSDVAKHTGLHRCGKSCRLRWINYLRPDLKRGPFSAHEVRLVVNLHNSMGNSWSKIATQLPGRTDNDVKNFWHSYTRSRRIQQQQQANKGQQNSNASSKSSDQKASSSHDQYYHCNGDMHRSRKEQESNAINRSQNYEDLVQLQSSSMINIKELAANCKSVSNPAAQVRVSDAYATLNSLTHTNLSSISYAQPSLVVAHHNQGIVTHEADSTHPLFHVDTNRISNSMQPLAANQDAPLPAFNYRGFPPQIFNDQCCSKESPINFQHFPPLKEASDHSTIVNVLASSHVDDIDCTAKSKTAVHNSNLSRISPLLPHQKPHDPHASVSHYLAPSFHVAAARSLPADYEDIKDELAADIKPPEGLQSVIWSFLKGQPEASAAADASDDMSQAQFLVSNHHSQHNIHVIKPQLAFPNYLASDHPPTQEIPSDQYPSVEAFSYTSPSNLQCLQAQYLADCFS